MNTKMKIVTAVALAWIVVVLLVLLAAPLWALEPQTAICYTFDDGGYSYFYPATVPDPNGSGLEFMVDPELAVYIQGACIARFPAPATAFEVIPDPVGAIDCFAATATEPVHSAEVLTFTTDGAVLTWIDANDGDQYWATPGLTCRLWRFL